MASLAGVARGAIARQHANVYNGVRPATSAAAAALKNIVSAAKRTFGAPPGAIAVESVSKVGKTPKAKIDEKCGPLPEDEDDLKDMIQMVDPKTGWSACAKLLISATNAVTFLAVICL